MPDCSPRHKKGSVCGVSEGKFGGQHLDVQANGHTCVPGPSSCVAEPWVERESRLETCSPHAPHILVQHSKLSQR